MSTFGRSALNLVSPPIIGWLLMLWIYAVPEEDWFDAGGAAYTLFGAYLFGAVPSVLHAVAMEFDYHRSLRPWQFRAVGVSAFSGLVAGALVGLIVMKSFPSSDTDIRAFGMWPVVGLITGGITGLIVFVVSFFNEDEPA